MREHQDAFYSKAFFGPLTKLGPLLLTSEAPKCSGPRVAKSEKCSTDIIFGPKYYHEKRMIYNISTFATKQRKCL